VRNPTKELDGGQRRGLTAPRPSGSPSGVHPGDLDLCRRTCAELVRLARSPAPEELGDRDEVLAGWQRLHAAHALVLDGDAIRMAGPFSAVPTAYRVVAGARSWYANCAWDAFGVLAALGADGRIEHRDLVVEVRGGTPDDESLVFHCLVPAARWWDDIVHT
jgi:alkylmercury lyase-like protein